MIVATTPHPFRIDAAPRAALRVARKPGGRVHPAVRRVIITDQDRHAFRVFLIALPLLALIASTAAAILATLLAGQPA